jgi:hypothetical protein
MLGDACILLVAEKLRKNLECPADKKLMLDSNKLFVPLAVRSYVSKWLRGPPERESTIFQHRKKYLMLDHIKRILEVQKEENKSKKYIKMQLSLASNLQATNLLLQYMHPQIRYCCSKQIY